MALALIHPHIAFRYLTRLEGIAVGAVRAFNLHTEEGYAEYCRLTDVLWTEAHSEDIYHSNLHWANMFEKYVEDFDGSKITQKVG